MTDHESTGRVIIADDTPHVRASLRLMYTAVLGLDVVGEASTARELLDLLATTEADILTVDRSIPGLEDPEIVEQIRRLAPRSRILLVNVFDREDGLRPCFLKPDYTISKSMGPDRWLKEIERILMERPPGIINLAIEANKHRPHLGPQDMAIRAKKLEKLHARHTHRIEQLRERRDRFHERNVERLRRFLPSAD